MESATRSIWRRCARLAFRSGSPGDMVRPNTSWRRLAAGAAGVQAGTAFAFCDESGLEDSYKRALLEMVRSGTARVFTDPTASPTSFPFKVAQLTGSLSDGDVYSDRPRICDLGYLREAYRTPSGAIDHRCSAEPVTTYVSKGGKLENTVGKRCLCNALVANIGQPQRRNGRYTEPPLITSGNDLAGIGRFIPEGSTTYTARDVVRTLLSLNPHAKPLQNGTA